MVADAGHTGQMGVPGKHVSVFRYSIDGPREVTRGGVTQNTHLEHSAQIRQRCSAPLCESVHSATSLVCADAYCSSS